MKKTILSLTLVLLSIVSFAQIDGGKMGGGIHINSNDIMSIQIESLFTEGNLIYGGGILISEQGPSGTYYNRAYGFAGDKEVGMNKSTIGLSGNIGIKVKELKDGPLYLLLEPVLSFEDNRQVYYDGMGILGSSTGNRYTTNNGYTEYNAYFQAGILKEIENDVYIKLVGGISVYGETTFGFTIGMNLY